jgi:stress response protein YsnF
MDLEAWKKELEFWRRRENGRQVLKVALESMEVMKDWHDAVILLLNPTSKGVGRTVSVPVTVEPVVVGVDADVEDEEEETERFLRSSSSWVSGVQSAGFGGGL